MGAENRCDEDDVKPPKVRRASRVFYRHPLDAAGGILFTGIIEEVGKIRDIVSTNKSAVLTIDAKTVLEGTSVGDSIAVNGACLTVVELDARGFKADAMPETMSRTNLGNLARAEMVNLERALPAQGRFGGHIVSGHIDDMARISHIMRDDNAFIFTLTASQRALRLTVEKGSVALNGISLTVVEVTPSQLSVSVIPHTMKATNLGRLSVGSLVNLECDIIAKYVERLIGFDGASNFNIADAAAVAEQQPVGISRSFLTENGFCG